MKRLIFLIIAFVFLLCGIAQAIPLGFETVPGSNLIFDVSGDTPSGRLPLHQINLSVPYFDPAIASISLTSSSDVFTNIAGFTMGGSLEIGQDDDASGLICLEFIAFAAGMLSLSDPNVRRSSSFDLLFDVIQPDIGTSAYMLHWDTGNQPIDFGNVHAWLNPSAPNQLFVVFDLVRFASGDILSDEPIFTTTISGDFAPVPEPTTILLLITGLIGFLFPRIGKELVTGNRF